MEGRAGVPGESRQWRGLGHPEKSLDRNFSPDRTFPPEQPFVQMPHLRCLGGMHKATDTITVTRTVALKPRRITNVFFEPQVSTLIKLSQIVMARSIRMRCRKVGRARQLRAFRFTREPDDSR